MCRRKTADPDGVLIGTVHTVQCCFLHQVLFLYFISVFNALFYLYIFKNLSKSLQLKYLFIQTLLSD